MTRIGSDREWNRLGRSADPRDRFVVDTTIKGKTITIEASGNRRNPIVWDLGDSLIRDTVIQIRGDHHRIRFGRFQNSMIWVMGDSNVIERQQFFDGQGGGSKDRLNSAVYITGNARYNLVRWCLITNWRRRVFRNVKLTRRSNRNVFERNVFVNIRAGNQGTEPIQIGNSHTDHKYRPNAIIRRNTFRNVNSDGELISLKASGCRVESNRVDRCRGAITIRHGASCQVRRNTMRDSGGVRVFGSNHVIDRNDFQDSDLVISGGDCDWPASLSQSFNGCHPRAERTTVRNNTFDRDCKFQIGKRSTGGKRYSPRLPADNIVLSNNRGVPHDIIDQGVTNLVIN